MNRLPDKEAQTVSIRRRVFSVPTLLSFGAAVSIIFLLATRFDLDLAATWENVLNMNPWLYLLAIFVYYTSFVFRGARWRILARNAGIDSLSGAKLPTVAQCAWLIVIGWFVNAIAWLRLGDPYRAYAFSEESGASFSWSLGTVFAERVIDMATVFILLLLSAVFVATTRDSAASIYIVIAAFVMAIALLVLMLLMKRYGGALARLLPGRLEIAYRRFHQGTLGSFKQVPAILALGLVSWFLEMCRLYLVVQALDLSIGLALVPVVALGHAILSTVPTPGGVGAVEPGVTGLLLLALERNDAVSVAVVDRSITYVSVIVIGGMVFLLRQILRSRHYRRQVAEGGRLGGPNAAADS